MANNFALGRKMNKIDFENGVLKKLNLKAIDSTNSKTESVFLFKC